jgi:hypothetical protein
MCSIFLDYFLPNFAAFMQFSANIRKFAKKGNNFGEIMK